MRSVEEELDAKLPRQSEVDSAAKGNVVPSAVDRAGASTSAK